MLNKEVLKRPLTGVLRVLRATESNGAKESSTLGVRQYKGCRQEAHRTGIRQRGAGEPAQSPVAVVAKRNQEKRRRCDNRGDRRPKNGPQSSSAC